MGRKTEKSKLKQIRVKEEKKQMIVASNLVKKANSLNDPLEDFPSFKVYKHENIEVHLECKKVTSLDNEDIDRFMELMRINMKPYYERCTWGWDETEKKEEMTEDAAWYLLARCPQTKKIHAFSHFRFDLDERQNVLYLYELQLDPTIQRKKLGRFMLKVVELIGFKNYMRKVVLTVLKNNEVALNFFSKLGYSLDETCPEDNYEEQFCYFIFSKINKNYKDPNVKAPLVN